MSKRRVYGRQFKLTVVRRMLAGENVSALSRELKIHRKVLYVWLDRFRSGGPEALRGSGRPGKSERAGRGEPASRAGPAMSGEARERIAELERKIGQQELELDFFRQALRQVRAARRPGDGPGVTGSMRSSKR